MYNLSVCCKKITFGKSHPWSMRPSSHQPSNPAYHIEDCWISIGCDTCLHAWLQTQILNGTYESIFTCYLDRLTNPVPSVLNIMRLCLPGTVQDAGSHKIGGHRPTKRGCFLRYFVQKE